MVRMHSRALLLGLALFFAVSGAGSQGLPPRAEGEGPYERLILRGVTVIDGTGAPPAGPVDVVIEGNRIAAVVRVGALLPTGRGTPCISFSGRPTTRSPGAKTTGSGWLF